MYGTIGTGGTLHDAAPETGALLAEKPRGSHGFLFFSPKIFLD
jgi:hypothetical protein